MYILYCNAIFCFSFRLQHSHILIKCTHPIYLHMKQPIAEFLMSRSSLDYKWTVTKDPIPYAALVIIFITFYLGMQYIEYICRKTG